MACICVCIFRAPRKEKQAGILKCDEFRVTRMHAGWLTGGLGPQKGKDGSSARVTFSAKSDSYNELRQNLLSCLCMFRN